MNEFVGRIPKIEQIVKQTTKRSQIAVAQSEKLTELMMKSILHEPLHKSPANE